MGRSIDKLAPMLINESWKPLFGVFGDNRLKNDVSGTLDVQNTHFLTKTNDITSQKVHKVCKPDEQKAAATQKIESTIKPKCCKKFKALMRDVKRFLIQSYRAHVKTTYGNTKPEFGDSLNSYLTEKTGAQTASESLKLTIGTLVSPKEALKLSRTEEALTSDESPSKSKVVFNDVIFKFTFEKAQELFQQANYKQILELYGSECPSQASEYQDELKTLLEC